MGRLTKRDDDGRIWVDLGYGFNPIYEGREFYRHIQKLAAYEDAEEEGTLVRLPCKVGDMVYEIFCGEVRECLYQGVQIYRENKDALVYLDTPPTEIERYHYEGNADGSQPEKVMDEPEMSTSKQMWLSDFGETVFLAREAAEAAKGE